MNKKYIFKSPNLKHYTHAFFTKHGGVSSGIYNSLNCGLSSNDKKVNIKKNREIISKYFKFDINSLVVANQFHSNKVFIIKEKKENLKCDSVISLSKKITLGVLSADCCPILVGHKNKLIFATIHVGWKGLLNGIIENFAKQIDSLNINASDLFFALGPCISKNSYEVDLNFKKKFLYHDLKSSYFFINKKNNKFFFNLRGYISYKLKKLGYLNIWASRLDTYKKNNIFFSYRFSCHHNFSDYGRMLSIIKY